jgi:hypothetical protein
LSIRTRLADAVVVAAAAVPAVAGIHEARGELVVGILDTITDGD